MPGRSYSGAPPPLTMSERAIRDRLRGHVEGLATGIGERNWRHYDGLDQAHRYVEHEFRRAGYAPESHPYEFGGETFYNVEAVLLGKASSNESIVIGAHYDSVEGSPGANDNATGVAALLELAKLLRGQLPEATLRFVAFANEEAPYFNTGDGMGSIQYARRFAARADSVRGMLSLETVGFYSDSPGSQTYPWGVGAFYPDRGNFIAFISNLRSRGLLRRVLGSFRAVATLPSEGAALPASMPGVAWSDHRSFWDVGIPAIMITDTAPFRDPQYHLHTDTPERLDYERIARLVVGLAHAILELAGPPR